MPALYETARPGTLDGIVGQEKAIAQVRRVMARGWGGRAWWITGSSGTGKTTLAYAIASEGADAFFTEELDASRLTPAKVEALEDAMRYTALSQKRGKAYIVNECHGLRRDTVRQLLVLLERLPDHVVMIFTTTKAGQEFLFDANDAGDAQPLVSRCMEIVLEDGPATQKAFAARAKAIAMQEGIDGLPESIYLKAVQECRTNFRALLQRIESGRFREDARRSIEADLALLKSTKGEYADKRRAELAATLKTLES